MDRAEGLDLFSFMVISPFYLLFVIWFATAVYRLTHRKRRIRLRRYHSDPSWPTDRYGRKDRKLAFRPNPKRAA